MLRCWNNELNVYYSFHHRDPARGHQVGAGDPLVRGDDLVVVRGAAEQIVTGRLEVERASRKRQAVRPTGQARIA